MVVSSASSVMRDFEETLDLLSFVKWEWRGRVMRRCISSCKLGPAQSHFL